MKRKKYLLYPKNYNDRLAIKYNNGCGPVGWKGNLIPDTIYTISIKEACKIHDFEYEVGSNLKHKKEADIRFRKNLNRTVKAKSKGWNKIFLPLKYARVWIYYISVKRAGKEAFLAKE